MSSCKATNAKTATPGEALAQVKVDHINMKIQLPPATKAMVDNALAGLDEQAKRAPSERPLAVLAKSGVSFDIGSLARVRFDAGGGQSVSGLLAARLTALWNAALDVPDEEVFSRAAAAAMRRAK